MSSHVEDYDDGHSQFLHDELAQFIERDPFAARFRGRIAKEAYVAINIHLAMGTHDHRFIDVAEYLFYWIEKEGGLGADWLKADDGEWRDDNAKVYMDAIPEQIEGRSQLSALGLYLIEVEIHSHGAAPYAMLGMNDHCFNEMQVNEHKAECLLLAYKCLVYSQRLQLGTALTNAENEKSKSFDFSALGKIGARKKHEPMAQLKAWTIEQYKAGTWPTVSAAAFDLQKSVIAQGRLFNAAISPTNAQRTIQTWISNHKKIPSSR